MQFQQPYNPAQYEPRFGFPLLPDGDYPVVIEKSEGQATKDGTGGMLVLGLLVINIGQGPAAAAGAQSNGAKLQHYLNLYNKNPQAVAIANNELSAICHAVGKTGVLSSSEELHNIPFIVTVGLDGNFNKIKAIKDINGIVPGKGAPSGVLAPSPVAATAAAAFNAPAPVAVAPAPAPPAGAMPWQQPATAAPPAPAPVANAPWMPPAAAAPAVWKP